MATVATMTATGGWQFFFEKFLTPDGRVPDVSQIIEEELMAPGVDGRRFRTIHSAYRQFSVQTLETEATFAQAITLSRKYDETKGTNVRLTISNLGGVSLTYERVHVLEVRAVPVPGSVAGATTTSDAAHVVCDWDMVVMENIPQANP